MKTLYDKDYRYTEDALELDSKARKALVDIFHNFVLVCGYSPREVSHVIQGTVNELELERVLDHDPRELK